MASVKEDIIATISNLPDDATVEDILEAIYVRQKIRKAQQEFDEGHYYTHEQAREILQKWLE